MRPGAYLFGVESGPRGRAADRSWRRDGAAAGIGRSGWSGRAAAAAVLRRGCRRDALRASGRAPPHVPVAAVARRKILCSLVPRGHIKAKRRDLLCSKSQARRALAEVAPSPSMTRVAAARPRQAMSGHRPRAAEPWTSAADGGGAGGAPSGPRRPARRGRVVRVSTHELAVAAVFETPGAARRHSVQIDTLRDEPLLAALPAKQPLRRRGRDPDRRLRRRMRGASARPSPQGLQSLAACGKQSSRVRARADASDHEHSVGPWHAAGGQRRSVVACWSSNGRGESIAASRSRCMRSLRLWVARCAAAGCGRRSRGDGVGGRCGGWPRRVVLPWRRGRRTRSHAVVQVVDVDDELAQAAAVGHWPSSSMRSWTSLAACSSVRAMAPQPVTTGPS